MGSKMEAYVALVSLMNTLHVILYPPMHWIRLDEKQLECLLEKVGSLIDFLEDEGIKEIDGLESQIARAAYAADDVVESYVLDLNLARSTGSVPKSSTCFALHVQKLIEEMEQIVTKAMKIKETMKSLKGQPSLNPLPAVSSKLAALTTSDYNTLVGFDDKVNDLMDLLTGQQSSRQIIAIVGMGGIGKTTLARQVFNNPYIVDKFDIRAWVTISQEYSVQNIILGLLSDIEGLASQGKERGNKNLSDFNEKMSKLRDDELGEHLHKSLYGRTYLIVVDDMWSIEACVGIRVFIPDNCNGSRIVVTSRLSSVAEHLSSNIPYKMEFLDDAQSWKLLCEKMFGQEGCPPELNNLGHTIAKNCRGLPLSILVIGGLLANSNKTRDIWEHVAENINSIVNSTDDEHCLKILSLSYNSLPIYLKPCFLHMVSIPKTREFQNSRLIELWVAEGFVKPIRGKTLEEVGHEYIMDLIGRNLVIIKRGGLFGAVKWCYIHDILRDLCLKEAQKENFLCVLDVRSLSPPDMECKRRLCLNQQSHKNPIRLGNEVPDVLKQAPLLRSLYNDNFQASLPGSNLRFLRVWLQEYGQFSTELLQLLNLRYALYVFILPNSIMTFPSSISLLWNLQTLDIESRRVEPILLPVEIWEMPQIRHLRVGFAFLPEPPCSVTDKHDFYILENLQSLMLLLDFRFTEEVVKRIPNLKETRILYESSYAGLKCSSFFFLQNLVHFDKLETLLLFDISIKNLYLPLSMKDLVLSGCHLTLENMTIIGSLTNLERL